MKAAGLAIVLAACILLNGCEGDLGPPAVVAPPAGITVEEAQQLPPLPPGGVRLSQVEGRVSVRWNGTGWPDAHYEVYRRAHGAQSWQLMATVPATAADMGEYEWTDPAPLAGAAYGVAGVSPAGIRSVITSP